MKKLFLLPFALMALALAPQAQSITFTFGHNNGGGESQLALDGLSTGSVTVGGLTLTATANSGTFNSTATEGFGINAAAAGDSTTEFDVTDVMSFSFNQPVSLDSIDMNLFGASDTGFLTYTGGTVQITSDPFAFSGVNLAANEVAMFGNNSGASFSLQSITVTVVPEPSTWAMITVGAGLLAGVQRFRRKQS
jgi:hypothetical protein